MNKAESRAETMTVTHVKGRDHVLIERSRDPQFHPDANYRNTNMALCGILRIGQSLDSFKNDWIKRKN